MCLWGLTPTHKSETDAWMMYATAMVVTDTLAEREVVDHQAGVDWHRLLHGEN
jgi:hypothetical protein